MTNDLFGITASGRIGTT